MKKILLLLILIFLTGCNSNNNIDYDTHSKTVTCTQQLEHSYVEETFIVESGHLTTRIITEYIPHKYYESKGIDIKEALNQEIIEYQNSISEPPYSLEAPYDNGENIVKTILITDYTDISKFEKNNIIHNFLTKDNKIIFDLYINHLQEAWKSNGENYSCSLN